MNILITGGCGFIGINFVIELLKNPKNKITIIDKISYLSVANHIFKKILIQGLEFIRIQLARKNRVYIKIRFTPK